MLYIAFCSTFIDYTTNLTSFSQQNPRNVGTTNLTIWFMPGALTALPVASWATTFSTVASATTLTDTTTLFS